MKIRTDYLNLERRNVMGNFKDFDLDLKQVKTNTQFNTRSASEVKCWETIIKTIIGVSKAAGCTNNSCNCSPSDMTGCRGLDSGIGIRC